MSHVFISYKRNTYPDNGLSQQIAAHLARRGHDVFLDRENLKAGDQYRDKIRQSIEQCDAFVVLLSEASTIAGEWVESETTHAWNRVNRPAIIPVRVRWEDDLPFGFCTFLRPIQHAEWRGDADTAELLAALVDRLDDAGIQSADSPSAFVRVTSLYSESASKAADALKPFAAMHPIAVPSTNLTRSFLQLLDNSYSTFLQVVDDSHPAADDYADRITALRGVIATYEEYANVTKQNLALVQCIGEQLQSIDSWLHCVDEYKSAVTAAIHAFKAKRHDHWQRSDQEQQKRIDEHRERPLGHLAGREFQEQFLVWLRQRNLTEEFEEQTKSLTTLYNRKFANDRDQCYARILGQVAKLTDANGISRDDVGFEPQIANRWRRRYQLAEDGQQKQRILDQIVERRPDDPFVLQFAARARHHETTDPAELRRLGALAAFATLQLPGPQLFDAARSEAYEETCTLFSDALFFEQLKAPFGALDSSAGADVIRLWTVWPAVVGVNNHGRDPSGKYRVLGLLSSGSVADGLELAKAIKSENWDDAYFSVLLACVASRSGDPQLAWTCLDHAIRDLHFPHVKEISANPELEPLRVARRDDVAALIRMDVEVLGRFASKLLPQFIVILNRSWFPLTNVVCACDVSDRSGRVMSLTVSAAYVPPRVGDQPGEFRIRSDSLPRNWLRFGDEKLRFRMTCRQGDLNSLH